MENPNKKPNEQDEDELVKFIYDQEKKHLRRFKRIFIAVGIAIYIILFLTCKP